ncbi:MAG: hypothetical protein RRY12_12875 [Cloacibacillus sp.]
MTTLTRENKLTAPTRNSHVAWTATNPVVPEGVLIIVKDRLYVGSVEYAIGDGVSNYNALRKFGEAKDADGKIDLANVVTNSADGLLKLDANGKAPAERLYITGALAEGAIIESGNNANGRYTKFADGTMICTKTITRNNLNISPDSYILRLGDEIPAAAFVGNSKPGWTFLRISATNNDSNISNNYMSCIGLFSYADGLGIYNTGGSMAYTSPGASVKAGNAYYITAIEVNIMAVGRWK